MKGGFIKVDLHSSGTAKEVYDSMDIPPFSNSAQTQKEYIIHKEQMGNKFIFWEFYALYISIMFLF